MILLGHVMTSGVIACGRSVTVAGPAMDGSQLKPLSVLTSVKMSKKLSVW